MEHELEIRNPSRWIVPAGISVSVLVMFLPVLLLAAFQTAEPVKALVGALVVLATGLYFAYAAFRAPVSARIGRVILIRRPSGASEYGLSQVRDWFFAIPNGLPTQTAPATNAVLHLTLADRTRFRGEVTAAEAAQLADRLPHVAKTKANTPA